MNRLAEKYEIKGLDTLAIEKFTTVCERFWDHPQFGVAALHIFEYSSGELEHGLKSVVMETISKHKSLLKEPEVKTLLREVPELAVILLQMK